MKRFAGSGALAAFLSMVSLGACGVGEPTEEQLRDATQRLLVQVYERMNPSAALAANYRSLRPGVAPMPRITAFRKIGCAPANGKPGFACDIQLSYDGKAPVTDNARFYPLPDGTLAMAEQR
ncbi:hypothetical protein ASF22_19555 [Methylobacterium sp. Leaf87]|uniref:hypothetical protein n=1 Tax=Methylobacterium sp. Leaf87 TaxID=1736243 RepID=UPI0006F679C6|nr:hypothetical protein [Methylobacterium sp. Leaf87]KQO68754.1 hypothetical protein ASF22_19555 [Methylobacterium sp. Leaf87]